MQEAARAMGAMRAWTLFGLIVAAVVLAAPSPCRAQASVPMLEGSAPQGLLAGANTVMEGPFEFTLEGRLGFPTGRLKVGEFPTGSNKLGGGGTPGTLLRLRDLGIDLSETLEGSVALHITPLDAVRASYLYYFLDGSTTVHGPSVVYNGEEFTGGPLRTNADFYRLSLAYERTLLSQAPGEQLIGSVGITYVNLYPTLTGRGQSKGEQGEDFYKQELPVPILGLRWDHPLLPHWLLRASVSGGGLPRVDSLRQEGGTVYLQQSHADVGLRLVYLFGQHAQLEAGYHFTYFFQHETSHEDNNLFELIDNGVQAQLTVRF